ncbi:hypothetical protein [Pseudomonas fluorescens]|uniref:hypothetical protein n=1 Tax=Pseudomonas fluorescens TaxID=294 RepID=UPI0012404658|nr:hypothetical protein [Pseudomonas fluorescens]
MFEYKGPCGALFAGWDKSAMDEHLEVEQFSKLCALAGRPFLIDPAERSAALFMSGEKEPLKRLKKTQANHFLLSWMARTGVTAMLLSASRAMRKRFTTLQRSKHSPYWSLKK